MVNINRLRFFIFENPDVGYLSTLNLFDFYDVGYDVLIGLGVDSTRLRDNLDGILPYSSYPITDSKEIDEKYSDILESVVDYCAINYNIDDILDIIIDGVDDTRKFYLESVLYYKSNQVGKKINKLSLNIKHFDDFYNQHSEDIFSYEILSNNDDFSETKIILETHLTEMEAKTKFSNFTIN